MEAEAGVIHQQTVRCQGLRQHQRLRERRGRHPPQRRQGDMALPIPGAQASGLQPVKQCTSVVLSPGLWRFVPAAPGN